MIPDVPASGRKCAGRPWGEPCPAYDDGTWPEGCDCYMQLNHPEDDSGLVFALVVCVVAAIGIIALTWVALGAAYGADNDAPCLTKEQARAKYPGQHLYWRTSARCWYGRPALGRSNPEVQPPSRAARPHVKVVRWNELNELDLAADRDTYFREDPVPVWRLVPIPRSRFEPWDKRIGM